MIFQQELIAFVKAREELNIWRKEIIDRFKKEGKQEDGLYKVSKRQSKRINWHNEFKNLCNEMKLNIEEKETLAKSNATLSESYTITKNTNPYPLEEINHRDRNGIEIK